MVSATVVRHYACVQRYSLLYIHMLWLYKYSPALFTHEVLRGNLCVHLTVSRTKSPGSGGAPGGGTRRGHHGGLNVGMIKQEGRVKKHFWVCGAGGSINLHCFPGGESAGLKPPKQGR